MEEAGFYALTIMTILMVFPIFWKHPDRKRYILIYLLAVVVWVGYLAALSISGLLLDFNLPPRLPLLVVVPAVLVMTAPIALRKLDTIIQETPLHLPVFLQSFRVGVELLIYATFLEGNFPRLATFEGINFDIIVGLTSILMGFGLLRGVVSHKGLMIWNALSLCILSLTVYSFIYTYYFTEYARMGNGAKLVDFPYLFLPGCLLPMAVFLHVFSIRQIMLKGGATTASRTVNES